MPLRDHFHGPLNDTHSWDELHGVWPGQMVQQLFGLLPPGFRPSANIHLASSFEIDVVTFEVPTEDSNNADTQQSIQTAPVPTLTVDDDTDDYEVFVYDTREGRDLVAAIEIISPSNQDRPQTRTNFINKIVTLVNQGVSVSVIDLVTSSHSSFYVDMLLREGIIQNCDEATEADNNIYVFTMRQRQNADGIRNKRDYWFYPLELGQLLPTIPIWLGKDRHIMLPLETSYADTCRLLHIK